MYNRNKQGSSPMSLRGDDNETNETYHPRVFERQFNIKTDQEARIPMKNDANNNGKTSKSRWLPRLSTTSQTQKPLSLRDKLSQKMGRISSLDSTRSSSSLEVDSSDVNQHSNKPIMPLISITSSENQSNAHTQNQSRLEEYNNYYGRSRHGLAHDKDEDNEEEDEFYDLPLPIPYTSSSSMLRSIVNQEDALTPYHQTTSVNRGQNYEEFLDDRQGMNNSEQQFTKGETADHRPSIDGSIISELRSDGRKTGGKKSKKDKQRRSKSPSSSSMSNNTKSARSSRHSRRGFLGLASRFKLTRKHDCIAELQLSILNSGFVSLKTMDRDMQTFLPKERMSPKDFEERVRLMRKYEVLASIEYRFASRYETYVCRHAVQESNQIKNNYKKCIPYDYNRVVLRTKPNVAHSDYINASHVDSYLKPNAYIAAQGPNEFTIEDFWRMIWEQKTFVIVMLTKVFDFIRVMCNQYWPVEVNKPERYGNLEVTLLYEEPLADFVIRTIKLTKLRSDQINEQSDEQNVDQQQEEGANKVEGAESELSGEDLDEYDSDESSISEFEDLIISEPAELKTNNEAPSVRAPKYSLKPRAGRQKRRSADRLTPTPEADMNSPAKRRGSSQPPNPEKRPPNEFLHPLLNASRLASSTSSISSAPLTPMTPRTPSSAGLDRSSATRKAVKKKRRARVKNARPVRTHFQVPDESQLLDDEDADMNNNDPDAARSADRIIYQFHYNSWASHTCPFISSLLHFRRRVRICMDEMSKSGKTGPTIVHCNDGCGRTGTYLAIDANLELAEEDNVYDVFNYTKKMRQSRKFLIENLEQYKFVYDTIEEAMFCGKTWFPVSELHKRLKHKSQRNPVTKKNEYLREYEKITRMTSKFSIGDCAGGHRVENREKNRDVSTVPPDNFRPYLTSFQTNDSTDYINAVFVDGYTRSKEYIVTEWPLHRTISDFWSLIYDHDCNSVILLANPGESSTYPSFLPSEKELRRKFGPVFSAEMVSYTHYQNIKSWIYTINKKIVSLTEVIAGVKSEAKTTQVFQITCWPQGHRVPTSTNALVELMNMVERWRQRTAYGPVCVVSLNGKSRAGVYCAANVAIEQVVQHSEVDVFQAVKTVRRHRPQLIENMTEYKYCYDLILHYVLHYVNQVPANS